MSVDPWRICPSYKKMIKIYPFKTSILYCHKTEMTSIYKSGSCPGCDRHRPTAPATMHTGVSSTPLRVNYSSAGFHARPFPKQPPLGAAVMHHSSEPGWGRDGLGWGRLAQRRGAWGWPTAGILIRGLSNPLCSSALPATEFNKKATLINAWPFLALCSKGDLFFSPESPVRQDSAIAKIHRD